MISQASYKLHNCNPVRWSFDTFVYLGGGPVEIGSGVSGLALAWVIGRRQEKELLNFRPHNVSLVCLGTFLLWFGWLGFNGGSALYVANQSLLVISHLFTRTISQWRKPSSNRGYMEFHARGCVWWHDLVYNGFSIRETLEYGRVLFRNYRWSCCSYTVVGIRAPLGFSNHRDCFGCFVQSGDQM